MGRRAGIVLAGIAALAIAATGCGSSGTGGGGTIIRGTTDQPVGYDPAGVYDLPSWDTLVNVYETVLWIPPGGNKPEPDAASSCDFTDATTYKCTVRNGDQFSDGTTLDSKDIKFSFDRNLKIAAPEGASSVLANLESTSAPDPKTVIFHLKKPDATFPFVLTMQSMAIVPADGPDAFPADKLMPSDKVVGSGHYKLASYEPGQQTVLVKNPKYTGPQPAQNDRAIIQYFKTPSSLKLALEQGNVDIAYRNLSATDYRDLRGNSDINVIGGKGIEIRYIVFNENLQPGDTAAQKLAIRKAAAQVIDRQAIAKNVYDDTVQPLYSMIPQGLDYAQQTFKDMYGASPNLQAAKQEMQKAGVKTPVDLELWYTPSHYGASSADEYAEIKHELDGSGLFNVTLKSSEWAQYDEAALTDKYPQFQFGWFPDYPDAYDYSGYFFASNSFLNDHYSNPTMDKLLSQAAATTDKGKRAKLFDQIQKIAAQDVITIPVWQGGQTAAIQSNVQNVEQTFDPAFLFRFWMITKS